MKEMITEKTNTRDIVQTTEPLREVSSTDFSKESRALAARELYLQRPLFSCETVYQSRIKSLVESSIREEFDDKSVADLLNSKESEQRLHALASLVNGAGFERGQLAADFFKEKLSVTEASLLSEIKPVSAEMVQVAFEFLNSKDFSVKKLVKISLKNGKKLSLQAQVAGEWLANVELSDEQTKRVKEIVGSKRQVSLKLPFRAVVDLNPEAAIGRGFELLTSSVARDRKLGIDIILREDERDRKSKLGQKTEEGFDVLLTSQSTRNIEKLTGTLTEIIGSSSSDPILRQEKLQDLGYLVRSLIDRGSPRHIAFVLKSVRSSAIEFLAFATALPKATELSLEQLRNLDEADDVKTFFAQPSVETKQFLNSQYRNVYESVVGNWISDDVIGERVKKMLGKG